MKISHMCGVGDEPIYAIDPFFLIRLTTKKGEFSLRMFHGVRYNILNKFSP